jgi:hypothetical protein
MDDLRRQRFEEQQADIMEVEYAIAPPSRQALAEVRARLYRKALAPPRRRTRKQSSKLFFC